MKTRIHTNGSAMLIIAIVVTAVSVTALVGVGLAGSVSNSQSKLEKSQELKYVVFGATQLAVADLATGALIVGQSKTYYVGGNPIVVVAAVNPSPANTCTLTLTGANASMPVSTTCVAPYSPTVTENCWSYGIFSNASFTWPLLGANKVTGSVYFRDSISILGSGGQVTKDFKTASSFNPLACFMMPNV